MVSLRRWLIVVHRYLGMGLCLLFTLWFVSGIAMIYARAMPQLTPDARLQRMPPLDLGRVRLTPGQAASRAGLNIAGPTVLLTVMGRPAYRFSRGDPVTVFADTGELLKAVGESGSLEIASGFMNLPASSLRYAGVLNDVDQWTLGQRRQMPLHKIAVADASHTELYISERLGEVVVQTTRGSRALAWVAAIPHWLYFAPLRRRDALWRQVVLWTSGVGIFTVIIGLVLATIQFAPSRPYRLNGVASSIPYAGLMRWHYITGAVFGVFVLTWVFSGWLSMEPWRWAASANVDAIPRALRGGSLDLSQFPPIDAAASSQVLAGRAIKEVDFLRLQGEPYYVARGAAPAPLLIAARSLKLRGEAFSIESIMERVREGKPDSLMVESRVLSDYDAYYYDRDRIGPLPVLRVKFADPDGTWVYIDPGMSQVVAQLTRRQRLQRWLYHGLHSLDFPFWYYRRPLWDAAVVTLCAGGTLLSAIGVVLSIKRLRPVRRSR